MAIKPQTKTAAGISALPTPPTPNEEIAALNQVIVGMTRDHELALARERTLTGRYKDEAEELQEQLTALLESPVLRILSNGGNLPEIEARLTALCDKCANANSEVKGALTLKIAVESGRGGVGSLEFAITDSVKMPAEDKGACILWVGKDGKLSESNAKQRDLIDVPPGPRRANPTAAEKLNAATEK